MSDPKATRYSRLDPAGLATAVHCAEDREDDVAPLAIMDEVERRAVPDRTAFRSAYISQHKERAAMLRDRRTA